MATAVRAAAPYLREGGRIISIGTAGADHVPFPGLSDYVATKGAVSSYTRGWARDFGPKGVTVNLVQPGPIDTDMNPADGSFAAVAFLASPDASFITGATLNVDGGFGA